MNNLSTFHLHNYVAKGPKSPQRESVNISDSIGGCSQIVVSSTAKSPPSPFSHFLLVKHHSASTPLNLNFYLALKNGFILPNSDQTDAEKKESSNTANSEDFIQAKVHRKEKAIKRLVLPLLNKRGHLFTNQHEPLDNLDTIVGDFEQIIGLSGVQLLGFIFGFSTFLKFYLRDKEIWALTKISRVELKQRSRSCANERSSDYLDWFRSCQKHFPTSRKYYLEYCEILDGFSKAKSSDSLTHAIILKGIREFLHCLKRFLRNKEGIPKTRGETRSPKIPKLKSALQEKRLILNDGF